MHNKNRPISEEQFAALRNSSVGLVTTFRRNGQGVSTPVGIKIAQGKAYFTTWSTTGKVKRLANNPHVTLAPCTRRGKTTGPTLNGVAQRLEGDEAEHVKSTLLKKTIWGQLWEFIYKLRGWQPVLYEVSPVSEEPTPASMSKPVDN